MSNLSTKTTTCDLQLTPFDNRRLLNLCGQLDEHLQLIESRLDVKINNRGNQFQLEGNPNSVNVAITVLKKLYQQTQEGKELTPNEVHLSLQDVGEADNNKAKKINNNVDDPTIIKTPKMKVVPRTENQRSYIKTIHKHDVNFGIGPAGTGKTFIAVACAVAALEAKKVNKIILIRPIVEAGERLGFLPGDIAQKIDPYLRPLYDALYDTLGFEKVCKLLDRQIIEIAPLAYMRGRTLSNAYIILDESQNTTIEQMKMFLTRIGFGSTAVITGDITQVDLPRGKLSGLKHAMRILENVKTIGFSRFIGKDIVRHPLVQEIIEAYDRDSEGEAS